MDEDEEEEEHPFENIGASVKQALAHVKQDVDLKEGLATQESTHAADTATHEGAEVKADIAAADAAEVTVEVPADQESPTEEAPAEPLVEDKPIVDLEASSKVGPSP